MNSQNRLNDYLSEQLETAKAQLGIIGPEADIEALHRFRVALRRFRSVLISYNKKMYAPDAIAKSMLKSTNALRETDVFLASVDVHRYPGLHHSITRYRRKQYADIWSKKRVGRFDESLQMLGKDITKLPLEYSDKKLIGKGKKIYEHARNSHAKLTSKSSEAQMHKTRLLYKQARYVLEFLRDAGVADEQKKIQKIKKLLGHFGAIQDAVNQLEWLQAFCREHPSAECTALYTERKTALQELKQTMDKTL